MISFLYVYVIVLVASFSRVLTAPKGNPFYVNSIQGSRKYYLIYHHEFALKYEESRLRCQSIPGGDLATIQDEQLLDYLSEHLMGNRPAFIKSFNITNPSGNSFSTSNYDESACLALYPGSIVAGNIKLHFYQLILNFIV